MATHAGLGRRHAREARFFDRGMAVAAVDAEPSNVVLVAERHRLPERLVFARVKRGAIDHTPAEGDGRNEQWQAGQSCTKACGICWLEKLCHQRPLTAHRAA